MAVNPIIGSQELAGGDHEEESEKQASVVDHRIGISGSPFRHVREWPQHNLADLTSTAASLEGSVTRKSVGLKSIVSRGDQSGSIWINLDQSGSSTADLTEPDPILQSQAGEIDTENCAVKQGTCRPKHHITAENMLSQADMSEIWESGSDDKAIDKSLDSVDNSSQESSQNGGYLSEFQKYLQNHVKPVGSREDIKTGVDGCSVSTVRVIATSPSSNGPNGRISSSSNTKGPGFTHLAEKPRIEGENCGATICKRVRVKLRKISIPDHLLDVCDNHTNNDKAATDVLGRETPISEDQYNGIADVERHRQTIKSEDVPANPKCDSNNLSSDKMENVSSETDRGSVKESDSSSVLEEVTVGLDASVSEAGHSQTKNVRVLMVKLKLSDSKKDQLGILPGNFDGKTEPKEEEFEDVENLQFFCDNEEHGKNYSSHTDEQCLYGCGICEKSFQYLPYHLHSSHKIDMSKYRKKFGSPKFTRKTYHACTLCGKTTLFDYMIINNHQKLVHGSSSKVYYRQFIEQYAHSRARKRTHKDYVPLVAVTAAAAMKKVRQADTADHGELSTLEEEQSAVLPQSPVPADALIKACKEVEIDGELTGVDYAAVVDEVVCEDEENTPFMLNADVSSLKNIRYKARNVLVKLKRLTPSEVGRYQRGLLVEHGNLKEEGELFVENVEPDKTYSDRADERIKFECAICSASLSNMSQHVRSKHGTNIFKYRKKYGNPKFTRKTYHKCKLCGKTILFSYQRIADHLKKKHFIFSKEYNKKYIIKSGSVQAKKKKDSKVGSFSKYKFVEGLDYSDDVEEQCLYKCNICGDSILNYNNHVVKHHKISIADYKDKYGEVSFTRKTHHLCKLCGKTFLFNMKYIDSHQRSVHNSTGPEYFKKHISKPFEKSVSKRSVRKRKDDRMEIGEGEGDDDGVHRYYSNDVKDQCLYQCCICGKSCRNIVIHIRIFHKLKITEYTEQNGELKYSRKTFHECKLCGQTTLFTFSKIDHHQKKIHNSSGLKYYQENVQNTANFVLNDFYTDDLDTENDGDKVYSDNPADQCQFECQICSTPVKDIQSHIRIHHGMNLKEYVIENGGRPRLVKKTYHICKLCGNETLFTHTKVNYHQIKAHGSSSKVYYRDILLSSVSSNQCADSDETYDYDKPVNVNEIESSFDSIKDKISAKKSIAFSDSFDNVCILNCKICNTSLSSLRLHVSKVHKLTWHDYNAQQGPVQFVNKVYHKCRICSKTILFSRELLRDHLRTKHKDTLISYSNIYSLKLDKKIKSRAKRTPSLSRANKWHETEKNEEIIKTMEITAMSNDSPSTVNPTEIKPEPDSAMVSIPSWGVDWFQTSEELADNTCWIKQELENDSRSNNFQSPPEASGLKESLFDPWEVYVNQEEPNAAIDETISPLLCDNFNDNDVETEMVDSFELTLSDLDIGKDNEMWENVDTPAENQTDEVKSDPLLLEDILEETTNTLVNPSRSAVFRRGNLKSSVKKSKKSKRSGSLMKSKKSKKSITSLLTNVYSKLFKKCKNADIFRQSHQVVTEKINGNNPVLSSSSPQMPHDKIYSDCSRTQSLLQCALCSSQISDFWCHIRNRHSIGVQEYVKSYGTPSYARIIYHKCKYCKEDIVLTYNGIVKHLKEKHKGYSPKHYYKTYLKSPETVDEETVSGKDFESDRSYSDNYDDQCLQECSICGRGNLWVRSHINGTHKLKMSNYIEKYGVPNYILKTYHKCKYCGVDVLFSYDYIQKHLKKKHKIKTAKYYFRNFIVGNKQEVDEIDNDTEGLTSNGETTSSSQDVYFDPNYEKYKLDALLRKPVVNLKNVGQSKSQLHVSVESDVDSLRLVSTQVTQKELKGVGEESKQHHHHIVCLEGQKVVKSVTCGQVNSCSPVPWYEGNTYSCCTCRASFHTLEGIYQHGSQVHGNIDKDLFTRSDNLYECQFCIEEVYHEKSAIEDHLDSHMLSLDQYTKLYQPDEKRVDNAVNEQSNDEHENKRYSEETGPIETRDNIINEQMTSAEDRGGIIPNTNSRQQMPMKMGKKRHVVDSFYEEEKQYVAAEESDAEQVDDRGMNLDGALELNLGCELLSENQPARTTSSCEIQSDEETTVELIPVNKSMVSDEPFVFSLDNNEAEMDSDTELLTTKKHDQPDGQGQNRNGNHFSSFLDETDVDEDVDAEIENIINPQDKSDGVTFNLPVEPESGIGPNVTICVEVKPDQVTSEELMDQKEDVADFTFSVDVDEIGGICIIGDAETVVNNESLDPDNRNFSFQSSLTTDEIGSHFERSVMLSVMNCHANTKNGGMPCPALYSTVSKSTAKASCQVLTGTNMSARAVCCQEAPVAQVPVSTSREDIASLVATGVNRSSNGMLLEEFSLDAFQTEQSQFSAAMKGPVIVANSHSNGHESDTNIGHDSNTNIGNESNTNIGRENSTNIGHESNTNIGRESSSNIGRESKTNIGSESKNNIGSESKNNTGSESETNTGSEIKNNTGSESKNNTVSESKTNTGSESKNNTGSESKNSSGSESGPNTRPESDYNESSRNINSETDTTSNISSSSIGIKWYFEGAREANTDSDVYVCPINNCSFVTDFMGLRDGIASRHCLLSHSLSPAQLKKSGKRFQRIAGDRK